MWRTSSTPDLVDSLVLAYPLAVARCSTTFHAPAVRRERVVSRRSPGLAPQPPNNRDGPTNQNQRPQPQDLEPSDRKPNEGVGTPPQPHAYGNHDSSITLTSRPARSRGFETLAGARSSTTERRGLDYPLASLAARPPSEAAGRPSGPPGWLLCGLSGRRGGGRCQTRGHEGRRGVQAAGGGMRGSGVADVRRTALRPRPRHRPARADVAGAARARGRPGAVGAGAAAARQRAPAGAGAQGGWAGGVLPERRRSLERAARGAGVHRPGRTGPRGGAGVARPAAADQRGRAGDRADGRVAAPAGGAARAGAALRDRLLGRAEPAGRPVQLHRHDRQPVRRRALAGPPASGLARRPPDAVARPGVRGDGRAATSTPSKRVRRRDDSP